MGYYAISIKIDYNFGTSLVICLVLLGVTRNMAINEAQKEAQAAAQKAEEERIGYDTILYVVYEPKISSTRILENDSVIVKGVSKGIYTYKKLKFE